MKLSYPIIYGLFTGLGLIAYLLLLSLFGLHTEPAFSIFNLIIVGLGIFFVVSRYKKEIGPDFIFQKGFMKGLTTGFVATVIFTLFFAIYATELNKGFLEEFINMWDTDWFVSVGMVIAGVALMGFASTLVVTYAFVQLNKRTRNTKEGKEHTY